MAGPKFFEQPSGGEVIDRLAAADHLTFVVGAGVSMESAFPSWDTLGASLIEEVGRRSGLRGDRLTAFVALTKREGPVAAASIARSKIPVEEFTTILYQALYRGETDYEPGETANALARLRFTYPPEATELATTNYDVLLEAGARHSSRVRAPGWPVHPTPATLIDDGDPAPGAYAVRHLHGVVRPDGTTHGDLVLAESDYHSMQHPDQWQERWFAAQARRSTVVFVGMSLTDPNMLRYLYRSDHKGAGGHVALFSRQGNAAEYSLQPAEVVRFHEDAVDARWRAMHVEPVRCDYYGQAAQFLYEVALRREMAGDYLPLSHRLASWERSMSDGVFTTRPATFRDHQDLGQEILRNFVDDVVALLGRHGHNTRRAERLHASIWLYRPAKDALVNWFSSDRSWRDPATLDPVAIRWNSPFAAVSAFSSGSVAQHSTVDQAATRWNHVVGAPLWIDEPAPYGRLPVGVLTIASSEAAPASALHRGIHLLRREMRALTRELVELFRP